MKARKEHGMYKTTTWRSWDSMMARCHYKKGVSYKNYGGRGIKVCDRWLLFVNFFADMGHRPAGKSLDRINNDGNYEPGNCRWATLKEQSQNRRGLIVIQWKGESHCATEWARILGLTAPTLLSRLFKGWTLEDAMTKGPRARRSSYVNPGKLKTHCKHGHLLSGSNLRIHIDGGRRCYICQTNSSRRSLSKRKLNDSITDFPPPHKRATGFARPQSA